MNDSNLKYQIIYEIVSNEDNILNIKNYAKSLVFPYPVITPKTILNPNVSSANYKIRKILILFSKPFSTEVTIKLYMAYICAYYIPKQL